MESPTKHSSRPIFIVGSPRSGTSVLTWALGQHPNLLLTEESNWLGSFAIQAAAAHAQGSVRALRSQLNALGITRDAFLSGLGDAIDRMILAGRAYVEAVSQETARHAPQQVSPEFAISRDPGDAKTRWVDGTPEYSLQIPALLYLFPNARFVHILRNVDQVATSLLAFRDEKGRPIVAGAEAAYAYWMRTTQACIDAEETLGPGVVHRVRYEDLVADGENTLRKTLDFLGESFATACQEPLKRKINSSFAGEAKPRAQLAQRSTVIEQARHLSAQWLASTQSPRANGSRHTRWRAEFDEGVLHAQMLQANWEAAQRILSLTRFGLNVCGMLLFCNWVFALVRWEQLGRVKALHWLGWASAALLVYLWLRRAGLRSIVLRMSDAVTRWVGKSG